MPEICRDIGKLRVLVCAPEGKKLQTDRDAIELISEALHKDAGVIVIPVERLAERFFQLQTGIAGDIVQKFVQYRRRLSIVGDVSTYAAESSAFAAFMREANRGNDVWFVRDLAELERRLQ